MEFLSMMLFALAVSLDGFGAGVAYGMRRIKIPWPSLLIICLASTVAISISMFFGHFFGNLITSVWAERIGSLILMVMGCWIIIQARKPPASKERFSQKEQTVIVRIKLLGIVVQVLREPEKADFDASGTINSKEAAILGFALAMDALGAGFGAALAGFTPFLTPLVVGIFKFLLLPAGIYLGANRLAGKFGQRAAFLPGFVLILLGIV